MPGIDSCRCGREHRFDVLGVSIGEAALTRLMTFVTAGGYTRAFLVCDLNTVAAAAAVERELTLPCTRFVLPHAEPYADERSIGEIVTAYEVGCDLIIGVGSGTINDLCRFVSHKLGVDYFIVATAVSMDGYASGGSSITTGNMKNTHQAHTPRAILGETAVLATAPPLMRAAGVGDILGKHVSLCDWELSHIVTGEYYCDQVAELVRGAVAEVTEGVTAQDWQNTDTIEKLMRALVQSGIAMSYAGSSRPAGGSEHHLSHFWEMRFLQWGRMPVLHGIKVGVATVEALALYERIAAEAPDFDRAIARAEAFSQEQWANEMRRIFGASVESVLALEQKIGKNRPENVVKRIQIYREKWDSICGRIRRLPKSQEIAGLLRRVGAPVTLEEIGVERELFRESVAAAKETRDRFGLLQMLFDLGIEVF